MAEGKKRTSLNSHKSWHVTSYQNREKVWIAEQAEKARLKQEAELIKQRLEEREIEAQSRAGSLHTRGASRMNWMYKDAASVKSEDKQEAALLGKGEVDFGEEEVEQELGLFGEAPEENPVLADVENKMRLDPMMAIAAKKREVTMRVAASIQAE
ncbi:pre-mRNA splicing factor, partial [Kipferlia bialata]|eukprot:g11658.t1